MHARVCFNDLPQYPHDAPTDMHLRFNVHPSGAAVLVGLWHDADPYSRATLRFDLADARALRDELRDAVDYAEIGRDRSAHHRCRVTVMTHRYASVAGTLQCPGTPIVVLIGRDELLLSVKDARELAARLLAECDQHERYISAN